MGLVKSQSGIRIATLRVRSVDTLMLHAVATCRFSKCANV